MPPAPMTSTWSPAVGRPRRMACTAIDIGWAIAATSPLSRRSSTLTHALAGTVVSSASAPSRLSPIVK